MLVFNTNTQEVTHTEIRIPEEHEVAWIRLKKPPQEQVKDVLEGLFHCHPLLVEDAVKLNQRPKLDRYKVHMFLTFFSISRTDWKPQEIGIVFGPNYIITISQSDIPIFDELAEEMVLRGGMMDHASEVLYHFLDRCVDEYSQVVNHYEDRLEKLERHIYRNPYVRAAHDILTLKRHLHQLRRIFVEEKTILGAISHQNLQYVNPDKDVYFIDVYDHLSRVIDSVDMFRESLTSLLELQMAMKSDRMNEIMKTLTLISSLFLPLTFIVGLYGMNFKFMPEINWRYGYGFAWILMIGVSIAMFVLYKRKKWM